MGMTQPSEALMSERAARVAYAALGEMEKQLDKITNNEAANYEKLDTLANVAHAASQFSSQDEKNMEFEND